jgi:DNA-binding transcriptional regulator YiaG
METVKMETVKMEIETTTGMTSEPQTPQVEPLRSVPEQRIKVKGLTGAELKLIRKDLLRLTQQGLADALGLSSATVSQYEQGRIRVPRLVELAVMQLCRIGAEKSGGEWVEKLVKEAMGRLGGGAVALSPLPPLASPPASASAMMPEVEAEAEAGAIELNTKSGEEDFSSTTESLQRTSFESALQSYYQYKLTQGPVGRRSIKSCAEALNVSIDSIRRWIKGVSLPNTPGKIVEVLCRMVIDVEGDRIRVGRRSEEMGERMEWARRILGNLSEEE